MANEWKQVTLGELFRVKHGFAFKSEYFTDEPQKTVLVTPGNFSIGGGFQDGKRRYYKGPLPEGYVLKPGQIVVTMTDLSKESDTLGYAARIPNDSTVWLHNQRIGLLEFKDEIPISPRFIEYLLRTREYRSWIVGSATGTTVKHTAPGRIESFSTRIPPLEEQRAIAHILGTLDDKIELNRKQNETLEAMARALFKAWFVDFEPVRAKMEGRWQRGLSLPGLPAHLYDLFPDRLVESELGEIPEGWRVFSFGDVAQQGKGAVNPTDEPGERFTHYSIPAFDASKMPVIELGGSIKSNKTPVPDGAVLVSKLNPHIPRVWLVGQAGNRAVCSTEFIVWTPKPPANSAFLYCLASSPEFVESMCQLVTGTSNSHQRVKPDQLREIRVFAANENVIAAFSKTVEALMNQILKNGQQSKTLAQLRNNLLPKLISGELRVAATS